MCDFDFEDDFYWASLLGYAETVALDEEERLRILMEDDSDPIFPDELDDD